MANEMIDDKDITECPFCKCDLRGEPILKKNRRFYPPGATHYSRLLGIEIQGGFDGVSYWECPDCLRVWDRFTGKEVFKSRTRRLRIQKKGENNE